MSIRICATCKKDETEVEFYKTGSYCKYCRSISEARKRYLEGCEKYKDNIEQLYKYQRFFLYNLHVIREKRSLEMCSKIMGFHVEELKLGLSEMGYYQDDPCWCSNCATFKSRNQFRKASNRKTGHQDWCNECKEIYTDENFEIIQEYKIQYHLDHRDEHLEYAKNYYFEHKEYFDQLQKEYYLVHREERLEYAKNYYQDNKDYFIELQKEYYLENTDYIKQRQREYYGEHKDEYIFRAAKRRALILHATPKWVDFDKIKEIYEEADRLQKLDGIPRHVDHIIPLQGKYASGLHVHYNLQILTAQENQKKSNKFEPIIKKFNPIN